ncbi:MAG: transketolase [Gemmatimonadales bacterium]|nr:transketolase [Gemmatimonadales bacterium]
MTQLLYVPSREFERARRVEADPIRYTAIFSALCRINTLYMIARAGSGHIGSSFSSLDVVAWLYLQELGASREGGDALQDLFFSSKGHDVPGLYAVLIGLGRLPFESLHTLRRLGGLPGHPDVGTRGMVTNSGPLGMGISKAKGIVQANRMAGRTGKVFVMTGDGELQEGQIWESLATAARSGMGEITAIVDHNKIQSDTWVSSVSDLGDLLVKFAAFGWHTARCDGHDLAGLAATLAALRPVTDRPKVIVADTVKGRGVSFMEHTALTTADTYYRFHSGAPDDATYEKAVAELIATADGLLREAGQTSLALEEATKPSRPDLQGAQRLVAAYSRALVAHAERDSRIVALDADLILDTGLIPFAERFPDRFIECGIAEQDMVSQGGGLALAGQLPVVHSFACFLSTRANEQIYNNATERRKVIYVGSLAGLLPGGPGHSHQSVRDISALGAVPGLEMVQPSCEDEVEQALAYALSEVQGSCYIRLTSIPCRVPYRLPGGYRLERGRGVALTEGSDAILFGYGPVMLSEAYEAAGLLRKRRGVEMRVVNLPWLNLVNSDWLAAETAGVRHVFTLDDHYVTGGQGELVAAKLAEVGLTPGARVRRFGVQGIPVCGQNDEVLRAHRLDAESLATDLAAAMAETPD